MAALDRHERLALARSTLAAALRTSGVSPVLTEGRDAGESAVSTGWRALDEALGGGLRPGRIVEIVGSDSSGRMSLALAWLSRALRAGLRAAFVDTVDALDPGALHPDDRPRVLWVRAPDVWTGSKCVDLLLDGGGFGLVVLYRVGALSMQSGRGARSAVDRTAAWVRLAHRAEKARCCVLVVEDDVGTRTSSMHAHAAVRVHRHRAQWQGRASLETLDCRVEVTRRGLQTQTVCVHFGRE